MAINEHDIAQLMTQFANIYNLKKWRYVHRKLDTIGQNYFGVIVPIELFSENDQHETNIFKLILKILYMDGTIQQRGAVFPMFEREMFVYTVILKEFNEIQEDFSFANKFVFPLCYYIHRVPKKEAIVLQDMSAEGYMAYVKSPHLDLGHMTVSLEALAKFHACSFILNYHNAVSYDNHAKICEPLNESTNSRFMDILKDRLNKVQLLLKNSIYDTFLKKIKENCNKYFIDAVNAVQDTIICHGDLWKENILFKYEDGKPISACIIDYQTCRLTSPAFDVLYLIISSTNSTLRQEHYKNMLDTYYKMFCKILNDDELDPSELYTKEALELDLSIVAPSCFITANTALWLSNGLQTEGNVKSKIVLNTKEEKEAAELVFKTAIQDIINDLVSFGYFSLSK